MYEFTASIPPLLGQEVRWKSDALLPGQWECFQLGAENLVAAEFRKNILVNVFYLYVFHGSATFAPFLALWWSREV